MFFFFKSFLLFCSLKIMERPPFWVGTSAMCCDFFVAPTIEVSYVDLRVALRNGSFYWDVLLVILARDLTPFPISLKRYRKFQGHPRKFQGNPGW